MNLTFLAAALLAANLAPSIMQASQQEPITPLEEEFFAPEPQVASDPSVVTDVQSTPWYSFVTNIPVDWMRAGQHTLRPGSVPSLAGIALLTGALMIVDHDTYSESHAMMKNSETLRDASHFMLHFGDGRTSIGIAAAFAIYGFAGDDRRALRTASQTVEATIASGVVVQLLKRISGRESPQMATRHQGEWRPFPRWSTYNRHQPRYYAFPSGHMTTAIATITVIAENYPEAEWIRPVGYVLAALMGASLVNVGWHWYSDFPLAIALGHTFGMVAAHRTEWDGGEGGSQGSGGLQVMPGVTQDGVGLTLALNF